MDRETVAGLIAMIRRIEGTCIVLAGLDSAYIEDKQPEFVRVKMKFLLAVRVELAVQKLQTFQPV